MGKALLTLYDPEKWDIQTGKGIVYLELDDNPCTTVKGDFDSLNPTEIQAKAVALKPAPPNNSRWVIDNNCLFSIPLWSFGVNADKSYSFYAKGVKDVPLTVTIERINVIPPVAAITKDLEFKAIGWDREGLNPNALPEYAGLFIGQSAGTYSFTLKEKNSGKTLDNKIQVTTDTGPVLATYLAPNSNLNPPKVSNPVKDYNITVGKPFAIRLPSDQFTDTDGTIVSRSVSGLPVGMNYDSGQNIISGTPTVIGNFVITVTGKDNTGLTVDDQFIIVVVADTGFQAGDSETYSNTVVVEPGMATDADKTWSVINIRNGKGKAKYTGSYRPGSGRGLRFCLGDRREYVTLDLFEQTDIYVGVLYVCSIIEVDESNPSNSENAYKNSPFKAEQILIIH